MKTAYRLPLAVVLCLAALEGFADQAPDEHQIEEIVVTAHPLSADGLAQPVESLRGEELNRKIADTIGATVAREPGIHSTSFGPAVGRPVIHGLDGARVRIMEDHVDTMDVSTTSGDHAVSVDPFIADEIDILKGPSTLLYGSGAIGGVIDVHTGRVPHQLQDGVTGQTGRARRGQRRRLPRRLPHGRKRRLLRLAHRRLPPRRRRCRYPGLRAILAISSRC